MWIIKSCGLRARARACAREEKCCNLMRIVPPGVWARYAVLCARSARVARCDGVTRGVAQEAAKWPKNTICYTSDIAQRKARTSTGWPAGRRCEPEKWPKNRMC